MPFLDILQVHGLSRRVAVTNFKRLYSVFYQPKLHIWMSDSSSLLLIHIHHLPLIPDLSRLCYYPIVMQAIRRAARLATPLIKRYVQQHSRAGLVVGLGLAASALTPVVLADGPSSIEKRVYAWGSNFYGQIAGAGAVESVTSPLHLKEFDYLRPAKLISGPETAMVITEDGELYMWGRADNGVLGEQRTCNATSPTLVRGLPPVVTGAVSRSHACAIDKDGNVWVWGSRGRGKKLLNDPIRKLAPPPELAGKKAVSVGCGLNHTVVVMEDGSAYSFGNNIDGALGLGKGLVYDNDPASPHNMKNNRILSNEYSSRDKIIRASLPRLLSPVPLPPSLRSRQPINTPTGTSSAIESKSAHEATPTSDPAMPRFVKVSCGKLYTLLLTDTGIVYSCGDDSYGQTGQGTLPERVLWSPSPILALAGTRVTDISAGESHAAVTTDKGELYVFGLGQDGQLGNGSKSFRNPLPVLNTRLRDGDNIAEGKDGSSGSSGSTSPSSRSSSSSSSSVGSSILRDWGHVPRGGVRCVQPGAGGGHTACLTSEGGLYTMGRGQYGQLGRGRHLESVAAYRDVPVEVVVEDDSTGSVGGADRGASGRETWIGRQRGRNPDQSWNKGEKSKYTFEQIALGTDSTFAIVNVKK